MGERYDNDVRTSSFDTNNRIDLNYVEHYKLICATPMDSLAKGNEIQNDLIITLEVPTSDYKNPSVQNIINWANTPVMHDDYYRDLAVVITMASGYRTVYMTHARITLEERIVTQADFVTMTIVASQKEDHLQGIVTGSDFESTRARAISMIATARSKRKVGAVIMAEPVRNESERIPVVERVQERRFGDTITLSRGHVFSTRSSAIDTPIEQRLGGRFVHFSDDFESYGGDQGWWNDVDITDPPLPRLADTGCGAIAAANIIFYYALTNRLVTNALGALPPSRETFLAFATEMYNTYTPQTITLPTLRREREPRSYGIWFMDTLLLGVKAFAEERLNTILHGDIIVNSGRLGATSYVDAVKFLKNALINDHPVALLVTYNDYIASPESGDMMEEHFVTITAMNEIREYDILLRDGVEIEQDNLGVIDYELVISNWGERQVIPSFKQMWESSSPVVDWIQASMSITSLITGFASVSLAHFTRAQ